jgi:hypothetical protein
MRTLELRRHSMRAKPGQRLIQAGVTLARRTGPLDRVITSTAPHALETAFVMGFTSDRRAGRATRAE